MPAREVGPAPHCDPARFDALIESVGPDAMLVVIARAMGPALRGRMEPEDVWQEALASAWRDRESHTWEDLAAYRRWIVTLALNRVRDMARAASAEKRGGERGAALFSERKPAESLSLADILPAGSVTPSRIAVHNERSRLMLAALDELPADVEPVVRLHLFEGRTMESIAADLGIHLAAAWRRFRRGVTLYRDRLRALDSAASRGGGA
ncbi:MAG: sigma-70 family RNA polymerase sigma factor [Planctomycetes bacterium]|nr:sigma-70 family RNA polymerase sigma factor [Planctomycetota bacterium]